MIEQVLHQNVELYPHLCDDNYTLLIDGYSFIIDESDIDYPIIDSDVYRGILKELNILKKLRIS
jgi:hypothetical protein